VSTILRWHPIVLGQGRHYHSNWGTMSPILMNVGDRGYKIKKIIRRSNSLRFTIYSIIMHYKHRVPQLVRIGGTKNFSAREFTFLYPHYGIRGAAPVLRWLFIELANKVRVRV